MEGSFAQEATLMAVAIVTALIGVFKYIKTEAKNSDKPVSDTANVVAASFIDSRLLRELIDTLRYHIDEYARENRKMTRVRQDLTVALEESTDAILANTDAAINILRFMKKQEREGDEK